MMSHDEFKNVLNNMGIPYESSISFGEMLGITVRGSENSAKKVAGKIQGVAPCTCSDTQDELTTIWTFPNQIYHRTVI